MFIDATARLITFRVLYMGPPGASKFLSMRRLQAHAPADEREDLMILHTEDARIVTFSWVPDPDLEVMGCRIGFEMVTCPGEGCSRATARLLLRAADAFIFLPDRADPGGHASQQDLGEMLRELKTLEKHPDAIPLVVQTYSDHPRHTELAAAETPEGWPEIRPMVLEDDSDAEVLRVFAVVRQRLLDDCRRLEERLGSEEGREVLSRRSVALPDPVEITVADVEPLESSTRWQEIAYWVIMLCAVLGALGVTLLL